MANPEHLKILMQGVEAWNKWRQENANIKPELRNADLSKLNFANADFELSDFREANLSGCDLRGSVLGNALLREANLSKANIEGVYLGQANLRKANLTGANLKKCVLTGSYLLEAMLIEANLSEANLSGAMLRMANLQFSQLINTVLIQSDLNSANFSYANLTGANLSEASLINANFEGANISNCNVFGCSAWRVKTKDAIQTNLIISDKNEPIITVDNLEIAQFIYLLLRNEKIRDVIDTIGKKAVLILGRFTPERKAVLDALREELRQRDYIPILFDFEKPTSRDLTETISTLAHLSRFIIADITGAKSIPQELQAIVPNLPSVAVQPIIHIADREYGMFEHFRKYPWVLAPYQYEDQDTLIKMLGAKVVKPAEEKVEELRRP